MKRILKVIHTRQAGFTLIELMISIAICGAIGIGAASVINHLYGSTSATANMDGTNAIENTVYWIQQDVQMSQSVTPGGAFGFPLTLYWLDWDNRPHTVTYSISGGILRRANSISLAAPTVQTVARGIDPAATSCSYNTGVLTLHITAVFGDIEQVRTYKFTNRPDYR